MPNELLKEKLAEEEEGESGPEPTQSALCQQFIGRPNPYRNPAPNVNTIIGDTIVQAGSQQGCSAAQNETTIAVNPINPRNLVAGSNDYRVFNARENRNDGSGWAYTSFDGGATWIDVQLPHLTFQTGATGALSYMDSAGDPAISFGPHNTVYYANLVFSRTVPTDGSQQASGLAVSVSRDGGRTWGEPSVLQLDGVTAAGTPTPTLVFNDKEWIAADPRTGTVYVTWTKFTFDAEGGYLESPIVMKKSTDFGRTWSEARRVAPALTGFAGGITPFDQGSNPQVGRDGTLYVAYEASVCETVACDAPEDHDAVVVATSRDGGRTFRNEEVALDFDFPETLTGENFRLNSYPLMAYDWLTDRLWITWADDRNGVYDDEGSVRTNGDVFVVGSRKGSTGWSEPLRVGSAQDEVFPAVAAFAGRVAVSYYTRRYDPRGVGLDYAYSVGWGRGVGGAPVRRITTQTSDPRIQFVGFDEDGNELQGVFIGDYSAIAMGVDLRIHPCWTDFRGRPGVTAPNQDVYTQTLNALH
ncbi:sialidase family protein [Virgisporangium aurantiacum]